MKKIIKQEFKEDKNGNLYEYTQLEETTIHETDVGESGEHTKHTKHTLVIMKSFLKDEVGEISINTKNVIDSIMRKR
jgi:hypothetical protein